MDKRQSDKDYYKMLEVFSMVTSLAFTTVVDFLLAYFGGNWLDNHFQTGDHTWRTACICLAVVAMFMQYYRLITTSMSHSDKDDKKDEE